LRKASLFALFLTVFIDLIGFGMVIPFLSFYAREYGASGITVGAVVGIYSIMQFFFAPVWGRLSDRMGRRPVLLISLTASFTGYLLFAFSHNLTVLFGSRVIAGIGGANIGTAQAYIADTTSPENRAKGMGLIGAAFGLGFILGPALSGVLAGVSYTAPIWAAATLTLVAAIMAWLWLPETVHRAQAGTGNPLRSLPALLHRPRIRRVLAIDFLYWLAFAVFQTTLSLFAANRFHFGPVQTGYLFAAFGLLGAIIQGGLIRHVVHRLGDKPTFLVGLGFGTVGLIAVAMAHTVPMFALALVPLAIGIGFGHPTMSSLISLVARGDEQGRVQGSASAVESLGRTIGPIWGNASLQQFGDSTPYISAAALLLLTLMLTVGFNVADSDQIGAELATGR
jgi:multidrug resistance protein